MHGYKITSTIYKISNSDFYLLFCRDHLMRDRCLCGRAKIYTVVATWAGGQQTLGFVNGGKFGKKDKDLQNCRL